MTCGIYKIKCIINNKCYVGSSNNIEKRFVGHRRELKSGIHHSSKLQNAWNKYKEENFSFEIVEECLKENLITKEQEYIDSLNSYYNGYNSSKTASRISKDYSKEHKEKLSIAQKKRFARDGVSESTKLKQSIARTGKKINVSEGNRKKKAEMCSNRKWSEESKAKISEANSGNQHRKGKKFSEESKRKISEGIKKANAEKRRIKGEIE